MNEIHVDATIGRICCDECTPWWNNGHWALSRGERTTFFGVCGMCGALLARREASQGVLSARSILLLAAHQPRLYRELTDDAREARLDGGRLKLPHEVAERFAIPALDRAAADEPPVDQLSPRSAKSTRNVRDLVRCCGLSIFRRLATLLGRGANLRTAPPRTTTARAGTHGRVAS